MSDEDWEIAIWLHETGRASLRGIGRRFGVSHQSIDRGLRRRGAIRNRLLPQIVAAEEWVADGKRARRIEAALIDWLERTRLSFELASAVMESLIRADREGSLGDLALPGAKDVRSAFSGSD